jgi:hypothetical protein
MVFSYVAYSDQTILDTYTDGSALPVLCDAVVQDHELDARTVFDIEIAGFVAHPVWLFEEQPKSAGCVDHDREYVSV